MLKMWSCFSGTGEGWLTAKAEGSEYLSKKARLRMVLLGCPLPFFSSLGWGNRSKSEKVPRYFEWVNLNR
jgi:hypothetical protein